MLKLIIVCLSMLIVLDTIVIIDARKVVKQFLSGRYNRKHAQKLHFEQTTMDKLTLNYIRPHLKKYLVQFDIHRKLYMGLLLTTLPQYLLLLICLYLIGLKMSYIYFFIIPITIIKIIILVYYSYILGPLRISKYGE